MQFYILMIDYGKGPHGPMGYGADVQPEFTRQNIVDQASKVLKEGRNSIAFIKFVDGNYIEDITKEIVADASLANALDSEDWHERSKARMQSARFDHARDLRKHGETV